jgi:hypothetical protein
MSAFGTKRTFNSRPLMSAFGGKADIAFLEPKCLLLTQSGHRGTSTQPNGRPEAGAYGRRNRQFPGGRLLCV